MLHAQMTAAERLAPPGDRPSRCMRGQGYSQSAQTPYALDNLRWIGDYIMKLHYADVEFCAQARAAPVAAAGMRVG